MLRDILKDLFSEECNDMSNIWHVIFEGVDEYETSNLLSHILDFNKNDCLFATKMNGEDLSVDHGYLVRVVLWL